MAYRKVYFRIKSAYSYNCGFQSDDARDQFKEESRRIFQAAGWTLHPPHSNGCSDTVTKGNQELYLHPMNFSGVVDETEIPEVEAQLAQATVFQCYHIDLYDTYFDMTDDAYLAHLKTQREEIISFILERYKTKRRNLYITSIDASDIAQKFTVLRICDKDGRRNKANGFISELMEQLVQEGRLVTAQTKHGVGIRTATGADAKQRLAT